MTITWKVYCDWQAGVPLELIKACALQEGVENPTRHTTHTHTHPHPSAGCSFRSFAGIFALVEKSIICMYLKQVPPPGYKLTNYPLLSHFYFKICKISSNTTVKDTVVFGFYHAGWKSQLFHSTLFNRTGSREGLGQGTRATVKATPGAFLRLWDLCQEPSSVYGWPFCCHCMTCLPFFLNWFFWPSNLPTKWQFVWQK